MWSHKISSSNSYPVWAYQLQCKGLPLERHNKPLHFIFLSVFWFVVAIRFEDTSLPSELFLKRCGQPIASPSCISFELCRWLGFFLVFPYSGFHRVKKHGVIVIVAHRQLPNGTRRAVLNWIARHVNFDATGVTDGTSESNSRKNLLPPRTWTTIVLGFNMRKIHIYTVIGPSVQRIWELKDSVCTLFLGNTELNLNTIKMVIDFFSNRYILKTFVFVTTLVWLMCGLYHVISAYDLLYCNCDIVI